MLAESRPRLCGKEIKKIRHKRNLFGQKKADAAYQLQTRCALAIAGCIPVWCLGIRGCAFHAKATIDFIRLLPLNSWEGYHPGVYRRRGGLADYLSFRLAVLDAPLARGAP